MPVALSWLITRLATGDYAGAMNAVWMFIAGSLAVGVVSPLTRFIAAKGENPRYAEMTKTYFARLLVTTDMEYFHSNMSGYLTTATRQFLDGCLELVRAWRQQFLITIFSFLFPILVIFYHDWFLGVASLGLGVLQTIYILWSSDMLARMRVVTRELYKRNSGVMSDAISNVVAIRSSGREHIFVEKIKRNSREEARAYRRRYNFQSLFTVGREVISVSFFLIILLIVVSRAAAGHIDLGVAVLVVTYTTTILTAIYALDDNVIMHDDLVDKIVPAFDVLNRDNKVQDPAEPIKVKQLRGDIELKSVSFFYAEENGGTEVFKEISLKIPHGQKLGVVGLSGAGKTTLAKLIMRFNDVDSGSVMVDGLDVRSMRASDLHRNIAYVPQEPLLLHTSIRDNVALAYPDIEDEKIEEVLRRAHALEFVNKLPKKLDSIVGERGVKLSGGEKQRVAIARALLQNAPIIILDEATSALDSESEAIIKSSFQDILRGKTAIVIAHRLSTLSDMDRIIVIDDGQIVEDGTHRQLLHRDKLYAKLWKRQQQYE
ncbi:ABC transporter ATP-binding protein/permease [Candidatus Saccharibacteria bacterium]|nr:ABC transporter ATP-binding protein/permease [Candidatus Saccharibacteria bacterium]